tara:strand:+ start:1471 stop:3198 length:1728 start_codon:yes stop_codon:yes gene_type:complete
MADEQLSSTGSVIKAAYEGEADTNAFTDALQTKLGAVTSGATLNSTDSVLLGRGNHTGTQVISTVSGLQDALDLKATTTSLADIASTGDFDDLVNLPAYLSLSIKDESTLLTTAVELLTFTGDGIVASTGASGEVVITVNAGAAASATWGGITGTLSSQTDLQNALNAKQATITSSDSITEGSTKLFMTTTERSKLSGVETAATADQTGSEIKTLYEALADTNVFTDNEKNKLAAIASSATANSSDAALLSRLNHTGTQAISTVSGLQTALDAEAATVTTINGRISAGTNVTITGSGTAVSPYSIASSAGGGGGAVDSVNTQTGDVVLDTDHISDLGQVSKYTTAAEITKLSGIATGATLNSTDATLLNRTNHTGMQAISTVTALQTTLDGKATSSHTHTMSEITDAGTMATATAADYYTSTQTDTEISTQVNAIVAAAPATLDTLNELAAALGDDPNFATTMTSALAGKAATSHVHAGEDITSGTLPTARISAAGVTQHQAALSVTKSQVSDLGTPLEDGDNISGLVNDENYIASDNTGTTGADIVTNILSLTQAEYDAITPNATTLYLITDAA